MTAKPLTKSLHTVRIVGRVARHVALHRIESLPFSGLSPFRHEDAPGVLLAVLRIIDNEPPTDPVLWADCIAAVERAIVEVNAERAREAARGFDWAAYERRVSALEAEGCTRSDAQGIVDAQLMQEARA